MRAEKAKRMSVSFKPETRQVNSYCATRGCTRSSFMNKAAELYLAECLEDQEDYEDALEAWKEFKATGEKTITLAEFKKELGV